MTGNGDKAAHSAVGSADQTAAREAAETADEQGLLFDDDVSPLPSEKAERDEDHKNDELAARRKARQVS